MSAADSLDALDADVGGRERGPDGLFKTVRSISVRDLPETAPGDTDVHAVVDAFRRPKQAPTIHNGHLPMLELPGFGSEYENCGDDMAHFCAGCGDVTVFGRTCYKSECPRCGSGWARRTATRVCAKLDALRRYRYTVEVDKGDRERMVYHHLIFSPPADWTLEADDPLQKTFDTIGEVLKELDAEGTVFYHPYRGTEGDDRGEWKKRLFSGRSWQGDVKEELRFSPHFHAVVAAEFVPGAGLVEHVEEATGWTIHRVTKGEDSNVSIGNDADLAAVVAYCLSHTGLYETPSGETKAAYRHKGSTMDKVTAKEDREEEIDGLVRAVAPKVLNIPFSTLACGDERVDESTQPEIVVDVAMAASSKQNFSASSRASMDGTRAAGHATELPNSADGLDGPAGSLPDGPENPVDVDTTLQEEEPETYTCRGRLLHIAKAKRYLEDDDWRDEAPYAEELREAYDEWSDRIDWTGAG